MYAWWPAVASATLQWHMWLPTVGQSLEDPFYCLSSELCVCNSFHGYFVPNSKKDQSIYTLVFLLEFHVVCELYPGYLELLG